MSDSSTERALRNSKDLKIDSPKQGQQQQDLANKDASASNNINAITTKSENPIDTALATHILTEASMSKKKSLCQICRKPILQNEKVRENCNFFFCHFHPSSIWTVNWSVWPAAKIVRQNFFHKNPKKGVFTSIHFISVRKINVECNFVVHMACKDKVTSDLVCPSVDLASEANQEEKASKFRNRMFLN